jgi:hypothetical protein
MRRTEPGKHYGAITAKTLEVLTALLWGFHNARNGLCLVERHAHAGHFLQRRPVGGDRLL